ncbi:MAG: Teichoic acid translocation permease protein TagG [Candidatus Celerinatantimonas neptuna]|nr:MAG: Teichoic acid translocation permease protein TagG [Candidatus Celerinatantimonas neptuna]
MSLKYYIDLILILTKKDTQIRYKNSALGYLWSIANPLCFALIYFIAFKIIMRIRIENYTIFLLSTLFSWQWINNSINNNLFIYVANASIIKKMKFPKYTLPLSSILMECFHFIITIPVIILFLIIYHIYPSYEWLYGIPLLLLIQILMLFSLSLIFSSLNLFFRDVERFVQLGIMMLFYATPILYSESMIPKKYHWILDINPFSYLIMNWRELFMKGTFNFGYLFYSFIFSSVFLVLGIWVYNKTKYRFAEVL